MEEERLERKAEKEAEEEEEPQMLMLGLWCVHGGPLER